MSDTQDLLSRTRARPLAILFRALAVALLTTGFPAVADDIDPLDDDSLWIPVPTEGNRGTLRFLTQAPEREVHHHENEITLAATSLQDGWVMLRQCHRNIDRVGRAQIVYNGARTEDLEIESHSNIGETWVEGASVQLRRVADDARLCVRARQQMLKVAGNGHYLLENGPFMRRFFDSFHPMRVTVAVDWGNLDLALTDTDPLAQPGFEVRETARGVTIETLFEGRLNTRLHLIDPAQADSALHVR